MHIKLHVLIFGFFPPSICSILLSWAKKWFLDLHLLVC